MSLPIDGESKKTRGQFRIDARIKVDAESLEQLRALQLSIYVSAADGYAYFSTQATGPVGIHTFLMGRMKAGQDGFRVDHINGDPLDNRLVNLRVVPDQVNQINRKRLNKNNKSGHRGVSYAPHLSPSKPWRATITVHYRSVHLGLYASQEEAVAARRAAEADYYPELCPVPEGGEA